MTVKVEEACRCGAQFKWDSSESYRDEKSGESNREAAMTAAERWRTQHKHAPEEAVG